MKKIVLWVLMAVFTVNGFAWNKGNEKEEKSNVEAIETTFRLKGTILDDKTNETVAGATVTINGEKYYSDFSGNFSIPTLRKGKYQVCIDYISYQSKILEIEISNNQEVNIGLQQR